MAVKQQVEVEGRSLAVSNLDKPHFPDGFTEAQVIDYYIRIASRLLPRYAGRPVTMKRFPDGVGDNAFYEKTPRSIHRSGFIRRTCPARQAESQSGISALTICLRSSGARTSRALLPVGLPRRAY